jgi:pimeloyl-[acyl-carrier protein] methyl ester esterase
MFLETLAPFNSNEQATPLVLLHGWALNGAVWGDARERLAQRHRLIIIDLPGHGRSDDLPFTSIETVAEQVAQHIPERCNLLGFSMGGMVAQRLLTHSATAQRIERAVLLSTTPRFLSEDGWNYGVQPRTLTAFAQRLQADHQKTMLEFLVLQALGSPDAKRQIQRLKATLFERGGVHDSVLALGIDALATEDLRANAQAIAQPTLIVTGERDTLTPSGASQWLADTIPNSSLLRFADGAHALFLSHTQSFCDAIDGFLLPNS